MESSAYAIAAIGISNRAANAIIDFIIDKSDQWVHGLFNCEPFNRIEMKISIELIKIEGNRD